MGLDMYLTAERYIGGEYEHRGISGKIIINECPALFGEKPSEKRTIIDTEDLSRVSKIIFSAGYWRKANHIHKWFVNNIQGGKYDCEKYYVSVSSLKQLMALCKKVLAAHGKEDFEKVAEQFLPTQPGVFFGGTCYDQGYIDDLENTVKIVDAALTDPLFERCDFYYQSIKLVGG